MIVYLSFPLIVLSRASLPELLPTTQPNSPVHVKGFRQILIWPLELIGPTSSRGGTSDLQDVVGILARPGGAWNENVNLYERGAAGEHLETHYAEFVYFHPFIQKFLYDCGPPEKRSMRLLQRKDIEWAKVSLSHPGLPEADALPLKVKRVSLYLFRTRVALLVMELALPEGAAPISLRDAEDLLDSLRRAYPPYWFSRRHDDHKGEVRGGHCPKSIEWLDANQIPIGKGADYLDRDLHVKTVGGGHVPPVASHWKWLLEPLTPFVTRDSANWQYKHVGDERMQTMAYLATDAPEEISDQDWTRLTFLDQSAPPDEDPYAPAFLKRTEADSVYDRFWDGPEFKNAWMNTRYLCAGYSFVMVGAAASDFFRDGQGGALAHFRHHYFQMGLIAYMQEASLLAFSDRLLIAASTGDNRESRDRIRRLMREFADFTSRFWFTEVTHHLQGKELFYLWIRQLGTEKLYDQVSAEFKSVSDVIEATEQRNLGLVVLLATVVGGVIGLLALAFTQPLFTWWIDYGVFKNCPQWREFHLGFAAVALLIATPALFLIVWLTRRLGDK